MLPTQLRLGQVCQLSHQMECKQTAMGEPGLLLALPLGSSRGELRAGEGCPPPSRAAWWCLSSGKKNLKAPELRPGPSFKPAIPALLCLPTQSCPTLCDPWAVAHQAPLSMGFPRQEYRSGLPFPPPEDLPDPGTEPESPASPAWQADSLPLSHLGS